MSSPAAPTGAAPAMRFSPMTVVAVLCIGSLSGALMQSLVIPIQRELPELLHTSASNASWAVTATLLAGAVTMPVTGRLADMYGKKRVLLVSATPLTRSSHHAGEDFSRLRAARLARLAKEPAGV